MEANLHKVDQQHGVSYHNTGEGNQADHRCGCKKCSSYPVPKQNSNQSEWYGYHHNNWHAKILEPADNQDINNNQHYGKRNTEITKYFECYLPFTIPFNGKAFACKRLSGILLLHAVACRKWQLIDVILGIEDSVNRAFYFTGNLCGNIYHTPLVFTMDTFFECCLIYLHKICNWHHCARLRLYVQTAQFINT